MFALLFLFAIPDETTLIDSLTEEETASLKALGEAELRIAGYVLGERSPVIAHSNWSRVSNGHIFRTAQPVVVSQVVDEKSFISKNDFWIEGLNTSEIVDDSRIDLSNHLLHCTGPKRYNTVAGSTKTILRVVPVDLAAVIKVVRPIAQARNMRVWGEGTNELLIAELVRSSSRTTIIKLLNGKRKTIKTSKLGKIDQEWLKKQDEK